MKRRGIIGSEAELYQELAAMATEGRQGVLATVVTARLSTPRSAGAKMIIHPDGRITGSVGGGKAEAEVLKVAQEVLQDGQCRTLDLDLARGLGVCGGSMQVFLEPVLQASPCVVIGAGHVGRAIVDLGRSLPFRFTVVDDRPEFLAPLEESGGVQTLKAGPETLAEHLEVSAAGALILASRSHDLDGEYLKAVMATEIRQQCRFSFLGVLGSRTKAARIRQEVAQISTEAKERLDTVQMPVGLDIGAETPHEIALSILAEVLGVLRGRPYLPDAQGQPWGVRLQSRRPGKGKE